MTPPSASPQSAVSREEAITLFNLLNPSLIPGEGKIIEFISAKTREGTSTIARALALIAIEYSPHPVLLIDFAGGQNSQTHFFSQPDQEARYGKLRPFNDWRIDPAALSHPTPGVKTPDLTLMQVGDSSLILATVQTHSGENIHLGGAPRFWTAARKEAVLTIVDAPDEATSYTGIAISANMDAVVLVVAAEMTRSPIVQNLADKLEAQNAPIVGITFNKRKLYIPDGVYKWLEFL